MIHLQPTKNAETIADYLHENGKQWQTKETVSIPHSFAGMKFTKDAHSVQIARKINDLFKQVYGVDPDILWEKNSKGKISRVQPIKDYRHAYRYWMAMYTDFSLKQIGIKTGGCDHSTVIHSREVYRDIYDQVAYLRDNHDKFKQLMA